MDINSLYEQLKQYLDIPYLIVFIGISYSFKGSLPAWFKRNFGKKISKAWAVFLIATIVAVPFWAVFKHNPVNLLMNWAIGCCLHQLFFKYIEDLLNPPVNTTSND
jgi:hypothetical protein